MKNDTYRKIGERVKQYRTERGLSQDGLADGICSRQTVGLLENGQHLPSSEIMKKIIAKLGVPFHEIMVDEAKELETKVQLDIIRVYVETGDYVNSFPVIEELEAREELLEYQRRELVLSKAECFMRTGRASQAVDILTELQQRLELERETDDHILATVYDKLGNAHYFLSNITNAHAHYMRAYQLTLRFPVVDITAARIAYNLGMACRQLNRQPDAVHYLTIAEDFFKKISDPGRLAQTMFELGIAFRFNKDFDRAEEYYQKALVLSESQNIIRLARLVRESYAFTILSRKFPEQAIDEMIGLAKEFELDGDIPRLAYTYARLARLLLHQGRFEEAGQYIQNAMSRFTEEEVGKQLHYVHVYQAYADYLFVRKDYEECVKFSLISSELFGKMGYVRDSADSLSPAINSFKEQGMFERALEVSEQMCSRLQNLQDII